MHIHQAAGRGLRASGWGKERRARAEWEEAPTLWDKPMSPSTEEVAMLLGCACPTGVVMVAPPKVPRNARTGKAKGRSQVVRVNSDPMIEAGAPSTGELWIIQSVPAPPGDSCSHHWNPHTFDFD